MAVPETGDQVAARPVEARRRVPRRCQVADLRDQTVTDQDGLARGERSPGHIDDGHIGQKCFGLRLCLCLCGHPEGQRERKSNPL